MTTKVIFTIDKKLKIQAMKKARQEGVAFASILKLATSAFIDGRLSVGLVEREVFNSATRQELAEISKDIKEGKNLSPIFDNAKDAIAYLKSSR